MLGPILLEKALIPDLEFFKFKTRGDCATHQAVAPGLLAFRGEPAPGGNQRLESRAFMP